ncbi:MAG: hypothetical protein AB7P37_10560 [Ramlibacter sp.]
MCWDRCLTVRDLVENDPRVSLANPVFERITTPGIGTHRAEGPVVRLDGASRDEVQPAPALGQHTEEVLARLLGLRSAEIGRLFDAGIVAGPERDPSYGAAV